MVSHPYSDFYLERVRLMNGYRENQRSLFEKHPLFFLLFSKEKLIKTLSYLILENPTHYNNVLSMLLNKMLFMQDRTLREGSKVAVAPPPPPPPWEYLFFKGLLC